MSRLVSLSRQVVSAAALTMVLALLPSVLLAQAIESGAIAGAVKDSSGAVLPGVTVEASSPALIEKVRTVLSDGQGLYKIIDLRPGTYTVTFSIPGFSSLRREGIELSAGFTATVNAELKVGAVEETVTVSGQSPVVDAQNVRQQRVFTQEVVNALPVGSSIAVVTTLIPGATITGTGGAASQDVGGSKGENTQGFKIHGSRGADYQQLRDGMFFGTLVAAGNFMSSTNPATVEEIVVETSGQSAEAETGGGLVNIVPREGSNRFNGSFKGNFGTRGLQSDNLTDELIARGLTTAPFIKQLYDYGGGAGGPLVHDRVWFFGSARYWTSSSYQPGNYYNKTPGTLFYTKDLDRPAYDLSFYQETSARVTWQVSAKDKVNASVAAERNCNCIFGIQAGTLSPEATGDDYYWPNWRVQSTWSRPVNSRLLLWAGVTVVDGTIQRRLTGGTYDDISVLEQSNNYRYNSSGSGFGITTSWGDQGFGQVNEKFTAAYITGSHSFKAGIALRQGKSNKYSFINQNVSYTFLSQKPSVITYWAGPYAYSLDQDTTAIFGQDQWTLGGLTLNLGVRYDGLVGSVPPQHLDAGPYVPARDFDAVKDVPNWKDISPRIGAAYDIFRNGKSAVKFAIGRYVNFEPAGGITLANNPVNAMVTSATRTWTDNGDFIPQESELGPLSDAAFGTTRITTRYADDVLHGWGTRGYSWQGNISWQQQLREGVALNVGYFRTWYGNFTVTDNLAVTPNDFDPYCITAPPDDRLGTVSGQNVCGLYDITPTKFGQVDNVVKRASEFGTQSDVFNGIDVTLTARFGRGAVIQGGMATGSEVLDSCFTVDSPQQGTGAVLPVAQGLYQCHNAPPWSAATQYKFAIVYPLPWQIQFAANYQNLAPIPTSASLVATNAQIAPSLKRNLGACGARPTCTSTATIELIPLTSYYTEPRNQQLDIRFTRTFHVKRTRIQPEVDAYNLFNRSPVLTMNTRYGQQWQYAQATLGPRLVKFGLQVYF